MSGKSGFSAAQIFSANRFKALDYVFESSTSVKVTMNLMSLPMPYFSSHLYAHSGKLPEDAYRTPWIRGRVISDSKLFVSGSVLTDLRRQMQHISSLERFNVTLSEVKTDVEVIPSSNPDSVTDLNQDEYLCALKVLQVNNPCQESFYKWTVDQLKPDNHKKNSLLLDELLDVDFLPQFKTRLPTLKAKVSRLRTLLVSDPLLSADHLTVCEDSLFRQLAPYEKPPDAHSGDTLISTNMQEKFGKESLMKEESLLLPIIVDTMSLSRENCTELSSVCRRVNVSPEPLEEQLALLDLLHTSVPVSVEISLYETAEEARRTRQINSTLLESEPTGRLKLPTDLELDETLNSTPDWSRENGKRASTCTLQREAISPLCRRSLVPASAQAQMETALWAAEKHLKFVAAFLLAEPHVHEEASDFDRLSAALRATKFDRAEEKPPSQMRMETPMLNSSRDCEFTERFRQKFLPEKLKKMEDFTKLSPKRTEATDQLVFMKPSNETQLKKSDAAAFLTEAPAESQREKVADSSQNSSLKNLNSSSRVSGERPSDVPAQRNIIFSGKGVRPPTPSSRLKLRDDCRRLQGIKPPAETHLDPLSTFMLLRSQLAAAPAAPKEEKQVPAELQTPVKLQTPLEQNQTPDKRPVFMSNTVSGNASRYQTIEQLTSKSQVIQVRATVSQQRAYSELLAFAQPWLNSARRLRLKIGADVDFRCLSPERTHFMVKEQQKMLCRTRAENTEQLREQGEIFNTAAQVHVLVTFKELLLTCGLQMALEYLRREAEASAESSLQLLLKRLQIIVLLSEQQQETNFKLLQLQRLLQMLLQDQTAWSYTEKILILTSDDSDACRSLMVNSLSKVPGAAVSAVRPEEDQQKLNGATVVSSVSDSVCVLVCEQHVGADFPWTCFSLVVEFDLLGSSPWSKICSERNIRLLRFNTVVSHSEAEESSWCLEENVPYSLFVTDGLLNCPLLLQTLESRFNITVMERSHCPSLQMLGGVHQYSVITVDEKTAIVLQREEELCEERASERVVMRLTALSLQFSCCWFILLSSELQGGGFSSAVFSSLVLVFSSVLLFSSSEDLNMKVLLVSGEVEMAEWISRICFHSLMSSDRDPLDYLDRSWLTVIPSQEEQRLLQFPCVNPLVGQLMLSRAPSLHWLLSASLSQLQQLFPELPNKVLKMFSDTSALHMPTTEPQAIISEIIRQTEEPANQQGGPPEEPQHLTSGPEPPIGPHPEFTCSQSSFVFRADHSFCELNLDLQDQNMDFRLDLTSSFGSQGVQLQSGWSVMDLWGEEEPGVQEVSRWTGRSGAAGRDAQREDWTLEKPESPFRFSYSPVLQQLTAGHMTSLSAGYSDAQHPGGTLYSLSAPPGLTQRGEGQSSDVVFTHRGATAETAKYNFRCWLGQERKRSAEDSCLLHTGLLPLKRSRLSYEPVPGRSDGQTRLRLF